MAPRWFKNINFGRDLTNVHNNEIIENFRSAFEKRVDQITFDSTGPIIEEIVSEDEDCAQMQIDDGRSGSLHSRSRSLLLDHQDALRELPGFTDDHTQDFSSHSSEDPLEDLSDDLSTDSSEQLLEGEEEDEDEDEVQDDLLEKEEEQLEEREDEDEENDEDEDDEEEAQIVQDELQEEEPDELQKDLQKEVPFELHEESSEELQREKSVDSARNLAVESIEELPQNISVQARAPSLLKSPQNATVVSPPQNDEALLRRSKRNRIKPLDFARGERPIYKRNGLTFENVGIHEGFPSINKYGKKNANKRTQQMKPPKDAKLAEPIQFRDAQKGDYKLSLNEISDVIIGFIHLGVGKVKPISQTKYNRHFTFRVEKGSVIIHIIKDGKRSNILVNSKCLPVAIPQAARYRIRNCGNQTAHLLYIVNNRK